MKLRYVLPIPILVIAAVALAKSDGLSAELRSQMNMDSSAPDRSTAQAGYAKVVEKVSPSVVSILVAKEARARQTALPDMFDDPLFRRFFEEMQPDLEERRQSPLPRQRGQGSGVIVTKDGFVITNNHVVEDADEIIVKLPNDKKEYNAEVVGLDPRTDLALIKIKGNNFPAATIGDSSQLRVGDRVLAIGNPFGLDQTVTSGIVSALNRSNMNIVRGDDNFGGYENFIQTDASINPGNSGGALIDHEGRVIGINTAIFSRVGGNIGIGFAIPINMAVDIASRLQDKGTVERGYLGVLLGELTPELAKGFGLKNSDGVLVQQVMDGTPAAKAGFKDGDIIKTYRGQEMNDLNQLRFRVAQTAPGTEAEFGVVRDGKEKTLTAKIGLLPTDLQASVGTTRSTPEEASATILEGVEVANLTDDLRTSLRLSEDIPDGVVVTEVDPSSAAGEAGLTAGMVITEVGRKAVSNVSEAKKALEGADDVVLLRVATSEGSRFVAVER